MTNTRPRGTAPQFAPNSGENAVQSPQISPFQALLRDQCGITPQLSAAAASRSPMFRLHTRSIVDLLTSGLRSRIGAESCAARARFGLTGDVKARLPEFGLYHQKGLADV